MRLDHLLSREQAEGKPDASNRGRLRGSESGSVKEKKEGHEAERPACPKKELSNNPLYRFQDSEKYPEADRNHTG